MATATNNYTINSLTGAISTIEGNPITESVTVSATPATVPLTENTSLTLISETPLATLPLDSINTTAANPNSRGVNDVSDIRPTYPIANLPIRGEKRLIPTIVDATKIQQGFDSSGYLDLVNTAYGESISQQHRVKDTDFYITPNSEAKRLQNGVDYIQICIPHRGLNSSSLLPDPTQDVKYRFLINPATLTVNRQTVDAQSMTRGGWQFGVWGEDCFLVQMQGTTAGSYFSLGTTDEFNYYTVAYRNLMQLQEVFENNGYWFEGEEYNEGPLAADYLRRRIRVHQDVELWCGNFIWSGMFDSFTISQDATQPFMFNFTLSFFVWKERYRSTSPYWGSIQNDVQRGHTYTAVMGNTSSQTSDTLSQYAPSAVAYQVTQLKGASNVNGAHDQAPAVTSANASDQLTTTPTIINDQIGSEPLYLLTLPGGSTNSAKWQGVLNP